VLSDFMDQLRELARQARLERDSSSGSNKPDVFFTARLRFRVSKLLEITACEQGAEFGPYKAILSPQNKNKPICESEWLLLRVRGLGTEEEAQRVGENLKDVVALSSARTRLGVDVGNDKPTFGFGQSVVEAIRDEFQVEVREIVHGLDVYSEALPVLFPHADVNASVLTKPEPFLSGTLRFSNEEWPVTPQLRHAVLLLNAALTNPEPLAQVALAISAVELLGQNEKWSPSQKQLLKQLAEAARISAITTPTEGNEVSDGIQRSYRLGLSQGVRRVLDRIGMLELRKEWDDVYRRRSAIFHGQIYADRREVTELAQRAITLCGRIIFGSLATGIPETDAWLNEFYSVPPLTIMGIAWEL
jgi:hypothetical protein